MTKRALRGHYAVITRSLRGHYGVITKRHCTDAVGIVLTKYGQSTGIVLAFLVILNCCRGECQSRSACMRDCAARLDHASIAPSKSNLRRGRCNTNIPVFPVTGLAGLGTGIVLGHYEAALYLHCTCIVFALYLHCTGIVQAKYGHCTWALRSPPSDGSSRLCPLARV